MLVRLDFQRHALDYFQAVAVKSDYLLRIVRHESYLSHADVPEDLGSDTVVPEIGTEAELLIGFYGVESLVLELVGPELVRQPDPPAFLAHVEHHSATLLLHKADGG